MEINKAEISRAMSLADVYMIGEDKSETLLTPKNFYLKVESESTEDGDDKKEPTPEPDNESGGDAIV